MLMHRLLITAAALLVGIVAIPGAPCAQTVMKLANATVNDVQHEWQKLFVAALSARVGDKIKAVVNMGKSTHEFEQRLQKQFGDSTAFQLVPNGERNFIVAIGVDGELTPQRVTEVQDGAWKTFADCFAKDGFVPVTRFAIGRPEHVGEGHHGGVSDWAANMVEADALAKRTGIPAPPIVKFLPSNIEVRGEGAQPDAGGADKDKKKDEEDGGGGGK